MICRAVTVSLRSSATIFAAGFTSFTTLHDGRTASFETKAHTPARAGGRRLQDQRALDTRHENDELHEEWLAAIGEQLAPVFEHSTEGVYIYLDDRHKICNEKLAKMWGFGSAAEWAHTPDFLNSFVATHQDRLKVSRGYHAHIHQSLTPVRLRFSVRRPDGALVRCEADMVPLSHAGQMFAYHFVRELPGRSRVKRTLAKVRRPARTKPAATRRR